MARKVRRVRKTHAQQKTTTSAGKVPSAGQTNGKPRQTSAERFRQEYAYVIKDLRRVFILAAAMFILLVVLNLALRLV